jgi:hypothetical protein
MGKYPRKCLDEKQQKKRVFKTSFSASSVPLTETDFGDFRSEYLDKYEAISETALARRGIVRFKKKTEGQKSRDTFLLNS